MPEPGQEASNLEKVYQDEISDIDRRVQKLLDLRRAAEKSLHRAQAKARLREIDKNALSLAARHLTIGEGPCEVGHVMDASDISALVKVVGFVAAYLQCEGSSQ